MDKISKFLLKLSPAGRIMLQSIIRDIIAFNINGYDVKPLRGYKDFYRLRKGKIRVVFYKQSNKASIIDISYRKDAYKHI